MPRMLDIRRGLVISIAALGLAATPVLADDVPGTIYKVKAQAARAIGIVTGPVIAEVQGVPAEPVDSFVHDGDPAGVQPLDRAKVTLEIDPVANTGFIEASWTDGFGKWTYRQTDYGPPPHSTGLQVGPSAAETRLLEDDPVTTDVYLHGDTTAGGPVLPVLFNLLATWGPAEVTLNDAPFENPFDGPAPRWVGHSMTTVGARFDDGTVRRPDGDIYDPMDSGFGAVDGEDLEFHLVFHDAPGPTTTNFPDEFSFFYHLQFEDVRLHIEHAGDSSAPE